MLMRQRITQVVAAVCTDWASSLRIDTTLVGRAVPGDRRPELSDRDRPTANAPTPAQLASQTAHLHWSSVPNAPPCLRRKIR